MTDLIKHLRIMSVYYVSQKQKCFFFLIYVYGVCFFMLIFKDYSQLFKLKKNHYFDKDFQLFKSFDEKFTIATEGCSIPALKPYDGMLKNLKLQDYPKDLKRCTINRSSLHNNRTHIWIVRSNQRNGSNDVCCYKSFYRPVMLRNITSKSEDHQLKYRNCVIFNDTVRVMSEDEFVRVTCIFPGEEVYEKFFLFAPKKTFMGRDETEEISKDKQAYNVIIMGLDGVSRLNFHRTMPTTLKYIKEIGAIELLGYNTIGDRTGTNIFPLLMGIDVESLQKTCLPYKTTFYNCPFVWERFKRAGYYTALAEDISSLGLFNYTSSGFIQTPTDYYTHTFTDMAEKYGNNKHYQRFLCSRDKFFYEILLDYIENLTMTLKSTKLFGFFWEASISHDELNYPMIMDIRYAAFFEKLFTSNYLDQTILFLISDHGMRYGEILKTKQGRLESRLPFVYVLVPPSFHQEYSEAYENLKQNSLRLTTPFDIHATLSDLVDMKNLKNEKIALRSKQYYSKDRGISLFLPMPVNRTCSAAGINDYWCTCHKSKELSVNGDEARQASLVLEEHLGALLESQPQCQNLKVTEVLEVKELLVTYERDMEWREFTIVVVMSPGGGMFEATLRYDDLGIWSVIGSVSRLNAYAKQSYCTSYYYLKLYCYCH